MTDRTTDCGSIAEPVAWVNSRALENARVTGGTAVLLRNDHHEGVGYWDCPLYARPPRETECRSIDLDALRKRAEHYYSKSYEIDHSDEYERDRLGHLAEGIEEAIEYFEAAKNTERESVGHGSGGGGPGRVWVAVMRAGCDGSWIVANVDGTTHATECEGYAGPGWVEYVRADIARNTEEKSMREGDAE
jgi:hypothetical protein